jgi:hypothetical protein
VSAAVALLHHDRPHLELVRGGASEPPKAPPHIQPPSPGQQAFRCVDLGPRRCAAGHLQTPTTTRWTVTTGAFGVLHRQRTCLFCYRKEIHQADTRAITANASPAPRQTVYGPRGEQERITFQGNLADALALRLPPIRPEKLRPWVPRASNPGSRPRSVGPKALTRRERSELDILTAWLTYEGIYAQRPRSIEQCIEEPGPCPWVSCRLNLYLHVDEDTGIVKLSFPGKEIDELEETCAMRAALKGGMTLEEVGHLMNISPEWVRREEAGGLRKLKPYLGEDD